MTGPDGNLTLLTLNNLQVPPSQVVLLSTRWNEQIVRPLQDGALHILQQYPQVSTRQYQVPGAIELSYGIQAIHQNQPADAYIALGCVIRGETPHFEYVCQSVTQGITQLNLCIERPVIFGVLTVNDLQQALDRIGGKHGHKGEEAALTALHMISFTKSLQAGL